jgi:hypothetical protein
MDISGISGHTKTTITTRARSGRIGLGNNAVTKKGTGPSAILTTMGNPTGDFAKKRPSRSKTGDTEITETATETATGSRTSTEVGARTEIRTEPGKVMATTERGTTGTGGRDEDPGNAGSEWSLASVVADAVSIGRVLRLPIVTSDALSSAQFGILDHNSSPVEDRWRAEDTDDKGRLWLHTPIYWVAGVVLPTWVSLSHCVEVVTEPPENMKVLLPYTRGFRCPSSAKTISTWFDTEAAAVKIQSAKLVAMT